MGRLISGTLMDEDVFFTKKFNGHFSRRAFVKAASAMLTELSSSNKINVHKWTCALHARQSGSSN